MNPDTFIVVAALDEADRIGATVAALARALPGAPVWVADDGSTDGTAELARAAGATVVRSERIVGKGQAMTAAVDAALDVVGRAPGGEREGGPEPVLLLCDGDLGESAARLDALVDAVRGGAADVAVAAFVRRVGGGFGLARGFARWAIRRRCGLLTSAPISGQRALSGRALARVLPFAGGFGMEMGITIDAVRAGFGVVEIELDLDHRATHRSLAGFRHRQRQLVDFVRAYRARA